jgi:hypothetical protein
MSDVKWEKAVEGSQVSFINFAKLAEEGFTGPVAEGEFVEAIANKFNPEKNDYKILKDDGTHVIVNGCGSLAYQMAGVKPSDYIRIEYNGKSKMSKGKFAGKAVHNITVMVAK